MISTSQIHDLKRFTNKRPLKWNKDPSSINIICTWYQCDLRYTSEVIYTSRVNVHLLMGGGNNALVSVSLSPYLHTNKMISELTRKGRIAPAVVAGDCLCVCLIWFYFTLRWIKLCEFYILECFLVLVLSDQFHTYLSLRSEFYQSISHYVCLHKV